MKKTKVLIIGNMPHYMIGGIENYNFMLLEHMINNPKYAVHEICLSDVEQWREKLQVRPKITNSEHDLNQKFPGSKFGEIYTVYPETFYQQIKYGIKFMKNASHANKMIKKIILENDYDWIIDNTLMGIKQLYKYIPEKTIYVQHNSPKFLTGKYTESKFKNFFSSSWLKIKGMDFIFRSSNVVFYDQHNLDAFKQIKEVRGKTNLIPLPYAYQISKNISINELRNRKNIIFASRLQVDIKGIDILAEIANNYEGQISVYGSGKGEKYIQNKENLKLFGKYQNQDFPEILRKYKFFLMTSREEGFGFTLVEALSNGVPIIVRDTFPSARFLTNDGKNGFLLDASLTPKEIALKLEEIMKISDTDYQQLVQNSLEFAKEKLSKKQFLDSWDEILLGKE